MSQKQFLRLLEQFSESTTNTQTAGTGTSSEQFCCFSSKQKQNVVEGKSSREVSQIVQAICTTSGAVICVTKDEFSFKLQSRDCDSLLTQNVVQKFYGFDNQLTKTVQMSEQATVSNKIFSADPFVKHPYMAWQRSKTSQFNLFHNDLIQKPQNYAKNILYQVFLFYYKTNSKNLFSAVKESASFDFGFNSQDPIVQKMAVQFLYRLFSVFYTNEFQMRETAFQKLKEKEPKNELLQFFCQFVQKQKINLDQFSENCLTESAVYLGWFKHQDWRYGFDLVWEMLAHDKKLSSRQNQLAQACVGALTSMISGYWINEGRAAGGQREKPDYVARKELALPYVRKYLELLKSIVENKINCMKLRKIALFNLGYFITSSENFCYEQLFTQVFQQKQVCACAECADCQSLHQLLSVGFAHLPDETLQMLGWLFKNNILYLHSAIEHPLDLEYISNISNKPLINQNLCYEAQNTFNAIVDWYFKENYDGMSHLFGSRTKSDLDIIEDCPFCYVDGSCSCSREPNFLPKLQTEDTPIKCFEFDMLARVYPKQSQVFDPLRRLSFNRIWISDCKFSASLLNYLVGRNQLDLGVVRALSSVFGLQPYQKMPNHQLLQYCEQLHRMIVQADQEMQENVAFLFEEELFGYFLFGVGGSWFKFGPCGLQ